MELGMGVSTYLGWMGSNASYTNNIIYMVEQGVN